MRTWQYIKLLAIGAFIVAHSANASWAEDNAITIGGVARSASLFSAIAFECSTLERVDLDKAKRYSDAFMMAGKQTFGEAAFFERYRQENSRLSKEIQEVGEYVWCGLQRRVAEEAGAGDVFLDNQKTMSDERMIGAITDFIVAGSACQFKVPNVPFDRLLRRQGFDLADFMPDGRHSKEIEARIKKTKEDISGGKRSCVDVIMVVRKTFPELAK